LFARIVDGDASAMETALERARRSGVHPGELAVLSAWQAARDGAPWPEGLPEGGAGLLLVTLEALLRVQEIDAFVTLLPAVELVGLSWRERREQLASMYLRRGYLESAADEWIAVCEQAGPDVAALIGLAQVAIAREMPDDAVVLAREIQAIEPGHSGAARIVERLAPAAGG
ncbi:MAG: hypothetical protein M3N16_07220, partial [Actinomycetota bacterium]|nr:hypothetical protein [Actinomycetota bacterium]